MERWNTVSVMASYNSASDERANTRVGALTRESATHKRLVRDTSGFQ